MKTNFLCRNALPRGSCVFLKMVVTVTALLCCQLIIYGQAAQTDIEIYECSSITNVTGADNIDLGGYSEVTRKQLKYDSNGDGNEDLNVIDLSGVTYSPVTGTLFMVTNKGPARIYEFTVDGDYIRKIDLTSWQDPEDIVHLYDDKFAIAEEKKGEVLVITIIDSEYDAVIDLANPVSVTSLPNSWSPDDGDGVEGVTYDPTDGKIHFVTEVPMELYSYDSNNPGSTPTLNGSCNLVSPVDAMNKRLPNIFGITDLSAIHHLRLTKGLDYLDVDNHILLLSDESNVLLEINEDCSVHFDGNAYTPYGSLQLPFSVFGGTDNTQHEGVTMDDCGNIYVVGEPNHFFVYSNQNLVLDPLGTPIYDSNTAVTEELDPSTQYCWRTKYSDECLWSPFSSFMTPGTCTTVEALLAESQISSGGDDVEEAANGSITATSSDLELVYESSQQKIGLLFRGLSIPQGAIVTNAYIQFTVDEVDTGTDVTSIEIAAHDSDDATPFLTSNSNVSNRPLTNARVAWKPTEWTSAGTAGADQRTPDISSVVQEIVNRPGWNDTSNKLAIIITGTQGSRIAESYNGSASDAPTIYVDYILLDTSDADNDGVCDADDACPGQNDALIGTACNDGDACTTGETYNANCNCTGGVVQDADNDGVCDADDVCPGMDDALIGTACNDGNACTTGETYDNQCNCSGGTIQDADNDGVCDADDVCPNFDDNLIGTACNDGNACTTGETYDNQCNCSGGTVQDADNDGVCDADDVCPNFDNSLIGTPCDDGSVCTTNDIYVANCECRGVLDESSCHPDCITYYGCDDNNPLTVNDIEGFSSDFSTICIPCAGTYDPNACPEDINISTYDNNQTYYEVSNTITTVEDANVEVSNTEQLTLNAGYYVKLQPGFKAKEGSNVRAYIEGCQPSGQKTEQSTLASVTHYPNPFKDEVTLEFILETDAEAQIIVSDVNGRTISQIEIDNLTRGIQTHSISTQDWISGIYFYQVQIRNKNTGILSHANGTLVKM